MKKKYLKYKMRRLKVGIKEQYITSDVKHYFSVQKFVIF